MGLTRVYIKPFQEDGTYASDFIEVTKYVLRLGAIKEDCDSLEYQLGVFRNSSVAITFNNRDGSFSDADALESMFTYKRADSIVKITWQEGTEDPICGFMSGEFVLSEEMELFEGLLNDDGLKEAADSETVDFKVLGYESLFARCEVPYTTLSTDVLNIHNVGWVLYTCLNQAPINELLVIDQANIVPATNLVVDSMASLEGKLVKDVLDELCLVSNSILYVKDGVVYVSARSPSGSVVKTFYGQAASAGIENIINVKDISSGINRCFNYFAWADTLLSQKDLTSIAKNLLRQKEVSSALFTNDTKRGTMLENLLVEFKDPKKEFELTTRLDSETAALRLLDRVSVDYPTVFKATDGFSLPVCGIAECGSSSQFSTGAVLPVGLWALTIDATEEWKILSREIDLGSETMTMKLRKV